MYILPFSPLTGYFFFLLTRVFKYSKFPLRKGKSGTWGDARGFKIPDGAPNFLELSGCFWNPLGSRVPENPGVPSVSLIHILVIQMRINFLSTKNTWPIRHVSFFYFGPEGFIGFQVQRPQACKKPVSLGAGLQAARAPYSSQSISEWPESISLRGQRASISGIHSGHLKSLSGWKVSILIIS